jgi:hypothetical protein
VITAVTIVGTPNLRATIATPAAITIPNRAGAT